MMFSRFNKHRGVGRPGHCKWCGRALRKKWRTEMPPTVYKWSPPTRHTVGSQTLDVVIKTVKVGEPKLGDYGDGHFCGLRCGYDFGLWFANRGNVLKEGTK